MIDASQVLVAVTEPDHVPQPLQGVALVATLNAVLGLWTLTDAANIAQVPQSALIAEAQAWAAAGGNP